jgi:hypothetical protein
MMRRLLSLVTVVVVIAAMMVAMAAPAIAQGHEAPPGGPCGVFSGFGLGEAHPTNVEPAETPPGIVLDCVPTGRPS